MSLSVSTRDRARGARGGMGGGTDSDIRGDVSCNPSLEFSNPESNTSSLQAS